MIRIRLYRRDKQKFEFTYRAFKSFEGQGVSVGVHPEHNRRVNPRDRITNAELAMVHEYGLNGLPERSFLRSAVGGRGKGRQAINKAFRDNVPAVLRGSMTAHELNDRIGRMLVDAVHDRMDSDVPPPNTELTEERKRGPGTLRESMQLYDSIGYKVGRNWRL
ncbi:tail protein [Salmonella phage SPLA2]|uniref:Uncharacterized protein n=1 Tax=Escherichia phage JEP7 TaxID=2772056 RepID=A0A7S6HSV8_9CAUD|nr:hypothetical protein [Salmonella enterica subsp. enterica serovar Agona]QGH77699.1 hypothetical protein [Escherichia phage BEC1-17]QOC55363.1 hypothetical protein JEP7_06 [Escherichia phage JEP7]WNT47748.1 tail protein [Salmonella phage SPLA2]